MYIVIIPNIKQKTIELAKNFDSSTIFINNLSKNNLIKIGIY